MECEEIKQIIPKYFQHTASEGEIQTVEEHLCVCHDCRTVLGELMDKASSAEEAAEVPSQEETTSQIPEKEEEPIQKKEEKPEEKQPEQVSTSDQKEFLQDEVSLKGDSSEGKEGIEYFPGEDIEASMEEVDNILGKTEPAKGDPGGKPEEVEPIVQDEKEEKAEDSSFEVILGPPAEPKQELPTESDIEALEAKDLEPVKEETKELEEKAELPLEEEKVEPPKEKAELPLEEEKIEEKTVFSFEDEKEEEVIEKKEEIKEEEEVSEPSPGTGIKLKSDGPEKLAPKEEEDESFLAEEGEKKETLQEASYALDEAPLEKSGIGLLDCLCLIGGLAILGFLAYLLLKG